MITLIIHNWSSTILLFASLGYRDRCVQARALQRRCNITSHCIVQVSRANSGSCSAVRGAGVSLGRDAVAIVASCGSGSMDRSAGPCCVAEVALRPVGDVTVRSEPSLLRLLDADRGQLSRARDRLSSFCRKLRRTISESRHPPPAPVSTFNVLISNRAFVFHRGSQARWKPLKRRTGHRIRKRRLPPIVSARCGAH